MEALAPFALLIILTPPLMSGIMAQSFGKSFWKWFFIGCLLPIVASIILVFMVKDENKSSIDN